MGFLVYIPFLFTRYGGCIGHDVTRPHHASPALLSLPLKIMLFVLSDGWNLIVRSLVRSFG